MSNIIDIYTSKFSKEKLVENNNFFNSEEEIKQLNISQQRHISSVNYYSPGNFARFGLAEEYYKNAINYINSSFPYSAHTEEKLSWINSLNDFEYHIYLNEFPKAIGCVALSGTQNIDVFSHIKDISSDALDSYNLSIKYASNKLWDLESGVTFESWIKFEDSADITEILSVTSVSSSFSTQEILKIYKEPGSSGKLCVTDNTNTYQFTTNIELDSWNHYAVSITKNSILLYLNGVLTESISAVSFNEDYVKNVFTPLGLFNKSFFETNPDTTGFVKIPVFKIGSLARIYLDETRFWNGIRSTEKIGRYWFTKINGNNFQDPNNSNLLFYFRYNEGWDSQYQFLCLDYSGRDNDGEINNFTQSCRLAESAIELSPAISANEEPDIIYKGLSYSSTVKNFYNFKVGLGAFYDETNIHSLYKKFPSWVLESEEESETKHLKQLIQIVSYYFDDLYNKIQEITNYKSIKYGEDKEKIYPFYDKILSSAGFNFTDLFTNLDIIEKISSRNDKEVFEGEISKIKNAIFQNIYNNLSYILKSKGTEKSFKSLLSSYGVNDNLVKINLYADNTEYNIADRLKESIIKKKTITLTGDNTIYLSSSAISEDSNLKYYTLETSVIFPSKSYLNTAFTSSVFGLQNNSSSTGTDYSENNYEYSVFIENNINYGTRFVLSGSNTGISYSSFYTNLFDDSVWNFAIRKKPETDVIYGTSSVPMNTFELYGVNKNCNTPIEFSCSLGSEANIDGNIRYYIGAKKTNMTGSTIYQANSKFLYCNFWSDYLNNEVVISHNKDILNYGIDE